MTEFDKPKPFDIRCLACGTVTRIRPKAGHAGKKIKMRCRGCGAEIEEVRIPSTERPSLAQVDLRRLQDEPWYVQDGAPVNC